jgi:RimJ/RimL family protein N-acetyltransferase
MIRADVLDDAMPPIPELTTERLLLRPFALEDAGRVTELLQRPEIAATTLNISHPYPEGAAASWIASHPAAAETGEAYTWAICRREDGLLMGAIGIHVDARHRRGEIGYWLGVPYWNQGFTTEAARAVIDYGFTELQLHRIEAMHLPRNVGSGRVMQKAGMSYEGTLRGYVQKDGVFEDAAMYAVLRNERG